MKLRIVKIISLLIVAWTIVAGLAARALIVREPLQKADAIVVMSGASAYLERTAKAAQLFHDGRASLILLTDDETRGGWDNLRQRNAFFVEREMDELLEAGVPLDNVFIVPGVAHSTRDEAKLVKDYAFSDRGMRLTPTGIRSVLIVTSAYHSRRTLGTFEKTFAGTNVKFGIEPSPDDSFNASSALWWVRPEGWRNVGGEYAKLIYYYFKYD